MPDNRHALPRRPDNHVIVLFGATGDLAEKLSGLFHLHAAGLLPRDYRIIGSAPASDAMTGEQFRAHANGPAPASASPGPTTRRGRIMSAACRSQPPDQARPRTWKQRCSGRRNRSGRQHLGVQVRQRDARAGLEPEHISYVQIDVPETLWIEGRAAFYDATGAYRDMIVTHLFQVMAFVAMEPPVSLSAGPLRDEKLKVFQTVKPLDVRIVVRGQYEGYRSEPGVAAGSQTGTMVAVRAEVDNWRWRGVPFFLRSGKSMGASLPAFGQIHGSAGRS